MPTDATGLDAILIFGGDGTIHRHLSDLVRLQLPGFGGAPRQRQRLRPVRSTYRTSSKPLQPGKFFTEGTNNVRQIDLGLITTLAPDTKQKRYFSCVAGVGLDTATARIANTLPRWLRANGGYAISLPIALARFTPPQVTLQVDGQPHSSAPRVLAAFANTPWYGGGMHIAPRADMADGQLDACIIGSMLKAKLLRLFPSVYGGNHLKFQEVEYFQATNFELITNPPVDVYADGEFVCQTPVEIAVAKSALTVIVPN